MNGKNARALLTLSPTELSALRDIDVGLAMFVPARQADVLIARGLVSRRQDGRVILTSEGILYIRSEPTGHTTTASGR